MFREFRSFAALHLIFTDEALLNKSRAQFLFLIVHFWQLITISSISAVNILIISHDYFPCPSKYCITQMMNWNANDNTWQGYASDDQNGILNIHHCVRLIISNENDHRVFD